MTQQIKLRRDTAYNWALSTNNPILGAGEVGLETDNLNLAVGKSPTWLNNGAMRFKIGDGINAWTSLPYSTVVTDGTYAGAGISTTPGVISFGTGSPSNLHGNIGDIYINGNGGSLTTVWQNRGTVTTAVVSTSGATLTIVSGLSFVSGTNVNGAGSLSPISGQMVEVSGAGPSTNGGLSFGIATYVDGTHATVSNNFTGSLSSVSETVTISAWVGIV